MESGRLLAERYELISHIARGGMADVWEARDTLLNRRVAVKLLHQQLSDDRAFVERFRREARAAANLSHPNIVSIYDWGEEGSTYFIVMELIDGRSLRDIIKREGALLPRRAAEIAAEIAAALSVAHREGIIHRDTKPANVLLAADGTVKVTDFGIARAWNDSEELTRTGAVIGTATYFSPEQARGDQADERSDIYSLGVVLYEMLTGLPPFTGDSPVSIAYQHVQEPAMLPSADNPDIPHDLERIVMRAMDKTPELRYQSALDVREDLLRTLRGAEPIGAAPPLADRPTQVLQEMPAPAPTVPPDETYRQIAPEQSSQMPFYATVGILVVSLVVLLVILFQSFGGDSTQVIEDVQVPNVVGLEELAAVNRLEQANLRANVIPTASAEVEIGLVVGTRPEAGTLVAENEFIDVIVSTGPQDVQVPNVVGVSLEVAEDRLTRLNLEIGEITEQVSEDVEEGFVIAQDPADGELVPPESTIDLIVSTGPEPLVLEDYRGRSQREVQTLLEDAGVTVEIVMEFDDSVAAGFVTRTRPGPGTEVVAGESVTVFVSEGPEPVALPSLIGRDEAQARALVESLGLVLQVSAGTVDAGPDLAGLIAEQFPDAGTNMLPGEIVVVTLGAEVVTTTTTTTTLPPTTTVPPTTTPSPTTTVPAT